MMKLTRDGLREILAATLVFGVGGALAACAGVTSAWPWWLLAAPLWLVWLFVLAFFRDPSRTIPGEPGLLVAPADGKVTDVTPLASCDGIDGPALQIGIFLSIFDVHINRSPCDGRIVQTHHQDGAFFDARDPRASRSNESNTVILEPQAAGIVGPIIVRQIAGLIARRIVCHPKPGASLRRGQVFGMIKFGSRTELIVPAASGLTVAVEVGQQVWAGQTVLMRLASPADPPEQCGLCRRAESAERIEPPRHPRPAEPTRLPPDAGPSEQANPPRDVAEAPR